MMILPLPSMHEPLLDLAQPPEGNWVVMVWLEGDLGPRPAGIAFNRKAWAKALADRLTKGAVSYLWDSRVQFCEVWDSHGFVVWRHNLAKATTQKVLIYNRTLGVRTPASLDYADMVTLAAWVALANEGMDTPALYLPSLGAGVWEWDSEELEDYGLPVLTRAEEHGGEAYGEVEATYAPCMHWC